jgi:hypothetical protein
MWLQEEGDLFPEKDGKTLYSDVDYVDTWKELEKLVDQGLAKSIGVSNFNSEQLERVLANARIKPVTNQVCVVDVKITVSIVVCIIRTKMEVSRKRENKCSGVLLHSVVGLSVIF